MPSNSERPFGHDTLKLRAVFVPEAAKDEVSRGNITRTLGYDPVKIPAVFVPEGGDRPGHPYEYFGKAVFNRVEDRNDDSTVRAHRPSWQSPDASSPSPDSLWQSMTSSSQSPDSAQPGNESEQMLPRTRYRFGAALSDNPPDPPNPTLTSGKRDPVRKGVEVRHAITPAGIAAWRSMANPGKVLRQSLAVPAPTQGEQGGLSAAAAGDAGPSGPGRS